jgi:hypothetical protein
MRTGRSELAEIKARNLVYGAVLAIAVGTAVAASPARSGLPETVAGAEQVEVTPALIREIQFMLLRLGMDPGPIDGVAGPQTSRAIHRFEERSGLPGEELVNGGRVSALLLARLRTDASRVILGGEKNAEPAAAVASPPPAAAAAPAQPTAQKPDRFAICSFRQEDFRIGGTQYTPDKYLQEGFEGSTARAVAMLKDRLNEARQIAENIGGAALVEVQRQSRVLDYFNCRLKVEEAEAKK